MARAVIARWLFVGTGAGQWLIEPYAVQLHTEFGQLVLIGRDFRDVLRCEGLGVRFGRRELDPKAELVFAVAVVALTEDVLAGRWSWR
ncbi:hypothetical protein ANRL4_04183 [Anaerolineae bacterium]|nr:hypothetical protein ANRL4_04183 [Anaerolineae bacterium]